MKNKLLACIQSNSSDEAKTIEIIQISDEFTLKFTKWVNDYYYYLAMDNIYIPYFAARKVRYKLTDLLMMFKKEEEIKRQEKCKDKV